MSGRVEYSVVQVENDQSGERLNAAVIFLTEGGLVVRAPRRLEKLRALSNSLDLDHVRSALDALSDIDESVLCQGVKSTAERLDRISSYSSFSFTPPSSFVAHSSEAFDEWASRLLALFVEPEPAMPRVKKTRRRLSSAIRKAFKNQGILARKDEGLAAHRIVPDYAIAEGLSADFVLKNGAMHVMEAVDASSDVSSLKRVVADIAVSALVLEQARMKYGERKTQSRLIYEASSAIEALATPSLETAANQGSELVNWASHEDRRKLLISMGELAEPLPRKGITTTSKIVASSQGRLKLN